MGTEKKSELHYVVLRLAESGQLAQLTKLMLDVEARLDKYKRLEEAARKHANASIQFRLSKIDEATLADFYNALMSVLKELEQE